MTVYQYVKAGGVYTIGFLYVPLSNLQINLSNIEEEHVILELMDRLSILLLQSGLLNDPLQIFAGSQENKTRNLY